MIVLLVIVSLLALAALAGGLRGYLDRKEAEQPESAE